MELLFGQTYRYALVFASARSQFLFGDCVPLRKLSISRIAKYHTTASLKDRIARGNGPLTLSSLGFENNVASSKEETIAKLGNSKPDKTAGLKSKTKRENSSLTLSGIGYKKNIDSGKNGIGYKKNIDSGKSGIGYKKNIYSGKKDNDIDSGKKTAKLGNSNSVIRTSSKVQSIRDNPPKTVGAKKAINIEGAPFAAQTFSELGLSPLLIDQLEKEGLTAPTDVQAAAIPTISAEHDVIIQSYTGSGKTLAYLLPILSKVGPLKKLVEGDNSDLRPGIEAVVVAPSRELGMQIVREVERLLDPADKKLVQQLVGGANRSRQEEALKKNKPAIVVGTPGRIAEISAAGKLHTHSCRFLVLDEVDQLLSFNYREDMHRILEHVGRRSSGQPSDMLGSLSTRSERQTIMVSATVPFSVIRAARSWGRDTLLVRAKSVVPLDSVSVPGPVAFASSSNDASASGSVTQGAIDSLPPALEHYYCITKAQHKVDTLRRCVHALNAKAVIVFMNNSKPLKDVVFKLEARGMKADELHGDLGKLARTTIMKKFKAGELRVLVTNELSARGLDVPECDLVVNLDLPTDSIHYAHRAGRTGRLGREGTVVTICQESEMFIVKKLRRQLSLAIQPCEFTDGEFIVSKEQDLEKSTKD